MTRQWQYGLVFISMALWNHHPYPFITLRAVSILVFTAYAFHALIDDLCMHGGLRNPVTQSTQYNRQI